MARADGNSGSGTQVICIEGRAEFEFVKGHLEIEIDAGANRPARVVINLSPTEIDVLSRTLRNRK
jgi:hypothetical protein